jgi:hypothetical protein
MASKTKKRKSWLKNVKEWVGSGSRPSSPGLQSPVVLNAPSQSQQVPVIMEQDNSYVCADDEISLSQQAPTTKEHYSNPGSADDEDNLPKASVLLDGEWTTVSYRPVYHQPITHNESSDEEITTFFSSLSGPELRDALQLVEYARNNSRDAAVDTRPGVAIARRIAELEEQKGSIDAAVLPGGKQSISQKLEPVFQEVSQEISISRETSERGWMTTILNEQKSLKDEIYQDWPDPDVSRKKNDAALARLKPWTPAGLHHVCKYCDDLIGMLLVNLDDWPAFCQSKVSIPHYRDSEMLKTSASGCRVCALMRTWTSKYVEYQVTPGIKRGTFRVSSLHLLQSVSYVLCQDHNTNPQPGQSLGISLEAKNVLVSPNSWNGVSLLLGWLKQCMEHEHCQRLAYTPLPTRIIDVGHFGSNAVPRLHHSNGESAEYLALSYCWGGQLPLRLMKSTVDDFGDGFNMDELPALFRDVIFLTRLLGIRYVWIDALCIIQDDEEDWKAEGAKMYSIYSNALFTISATDASNPSAGLFDRNATHYKQMTLYPHPRSPYAAEHECFHVRKDEGYSPKWMFNNTSTAKRGWILQERLSSTAVLHFMKEQMFWECRTCIAAENGHVHKASDPLFKACQGPGNLLAYAPVLHNLEPSAYANRIWYSVIFEYTQRNLTYCSDRLVALAGIASECHTRYFPDAQYLAGIWSTDLPGGLLWTQSLPKCKDRDPPALPDLPTWSWLRRSTPTDHLSWSDEKRILTAFDLSIKSITVPNNAAQQFLSVAPGMRLTITGWAQETTLTGRAFGPECITPLCHCGGKHLVALPDVFTEDTRVCYVVLTQVTAGYGYASFVARTNEKSEEEWVRSMYLVIEPVETESGDVVFKRIGVAHERWRRAETDPEEVKDWDWGYCFKEIGFNSFEKRDFVLV